MINSMPIVRAYTARVDDVSSRKRTITARINTCALDRFATVIDARGMDLSAFRANPTMLWEHGLDAANRGALPIGAWDKVWPAIGPGGPELLAEARFFSREDGKGDEFTERLFSMYKDGDLRGFSVRIIPGANCSAPTREEIRARPELADCLMMYRSSELAEASAVSVPGNADCLSIDEARSVLRLVERGLSLNPRLISRARNVVTSGVTRLPDGLPALGGRSFADARARGLQGIRDAFRGR